MKLNSALVGLMMSNVKLGTIAEINIGGTPSRQIESYWAKEDGYNWVSIADLTSSGKYIVKTKEQITIAGISNSNVKLVPKNTFIMSFKLTIGKCALAGADIYTNEAIASFTPKYENAFISEYLYYALPNIDFHKYTDSAIKGVTLNKQKLSNIEIDVPDLPTQKQVAKILSTVDGQIEKTDAIIAKYQAIKQGMLHDLFTRGINLATGKLRPTPEQAPELYKLSLLGLIPKDWNTGKMSKYLEFIEQGWSPNCEDVPAIENEWGILKTTAVTWGGYDQKQNKVLSNSLMPKHQYEVKINDILITRAGPNSRVGVVAYVNKTRNKLIFSDKIYRAIPIKSKITNHFLYLTLSSNYSQMELSGYKTGMAESQTNISQAIILKLTVIHPNIDEQELISSKIKKNDMLISSEKDYLTKLQKLKQGLMSKLLNGVI